MACTLNPPTAKGALRWLLAAVLAAASLVPSAALNALPAQAASFDANSAEQQLLSEINTDRAQNGLPGLTPNPILMSMARAGGLNVCGTTVHGRSQDMVDRNYFSHGIPPCGSAVWDGFGAAGITSTTSGENIGWNNYSPQSTSVDQVNSQFMNSPGHRANILGPFNQVGVGAAMGGSYQGASNAIVYTLIFINSPVPPPPAWIGWYPLGGSSAGAVSMGTNGDGRLEGFSRGAGGVIQHIWQVAPSSGWTGWYPLGNFKAVGDPAVNTNRDGRLEVFAVGTDGGLYHAWQVVRSGAWTPWYPLGGSLAGKPSVAVNGDGRLEVFTRGTDGAVWHTWQVVAGGYWIGPYSLGGSTPSDPTASPNADGHLEVFARQANNTVGHTWQLCPGCAWGGWSSLGGSTANPPVVAPNADGRLEVFTLGADGAVWHSWQMTPNGLWWGFTSMGGSFTKPPVLARNLDNRLEVFAVDTLQKVRHTFQDTPNGFWSGFRTLDGFSAGQLPGVGRNGDGRLEVLTPGIDGSVWHAWQGYRNAEG